MSRIPKYKAPMTLPALRKEVQKGGRWSFDPGVHAALLLFIAEEISQIRRTLASRAELDRLEKRVLEGSLLLDRDHPCLGHAEAFEVLAPLAEADRGGTPGLGPRLLVRIEAGGEGCIE